MGERNLTAIPQPTSLAYIGLVVSQVQSGNVETASPRDVLGTHGEQSTTVLF